MKIQAVALRKKTFPMKVQAAALRKNPPDCQCKPLRSAKTLPAASASPCAPQKPARLPVQASGLRKNPSDHRIQAQKFPNHPLYREARPKRPKRATGAGRAGGPPAGSGVPPEPLERTTAGPLARVMSHDVRRVLRRMRSTAGGTPALPKRPAITSPVRRRKDSARICGCGGGWRWA